MSGWICIGKSDDGKWLIWRHTSGRMATTAPGAVPDDVPVKKAQQ